MTSALKPTGSTRAWRRLRALVLQRDAFACRFTDPDRPGGICGAFANHVHHIDGRKGTAADHPANLAAACAHHNLTKGAEPGLEPRTARPSTRRRTPGRRSPDWSW